MFFLASAWRRLAANRAAPCSGARCVQNCCATLGFGLQWLEHQPPDQDDPGRRTRPVQRATDTTSTAGDRHDQYSRNRARAERSVAMARVSLRKIEAAGPSGSARSVQAMFT
jgi:hypothetical protein